MDNNQLDERMLKKLHSVEVEILDEFVRVCKKNNLKYFLIGGTLLGAVRHKGFIPWDDDIDIGMLREDYDKFLDICEKELNSQYYALSYRTNKKFKLHFLKVCKKNTLFLEEEYVSNEDMHFGIFIDIFPLDNRSDNKLLWFLQRKLESKINCLFLYKLNGTHPENLLKKIAVCILLSFSSLDTVRNLHEKIVTLYNMKASRYITLFTGRYYLKSAFFPLTEILFEGKYYNCPNQPDVYLKQLYDNYMELPPVEMRVAHSPKILQFDTDEIIK